MYLANFAEPEDRYGKIIVNDTKTGSERQSKPHNEGLERDFYRVVPDDANSDPNILEEEFGRIESKTTPILKKVISEKRIPESDEDYSYLISFIGLLAARVPSVRNLWRNFEEQIHEKILEIAVSSKPIFDTQMSRMEGKVTISGQKEYEEFRDFIQARKYKIGIPQNNLIIATLNMASKITELLFQRHWSVVVVESDIEMVSSDRPVLLRWISGEGSWLRSPGFGMPNTEVTIALSPKIALLGVFERKLETMAIGDMGVASFNSNMIHRADRFVYSRSGNPKWIDRQDQIRDWEFFARSLK